MQESNYHKNQVAWESGVCDWDGANGGVSGVAGKASFFYQGSFYKVSHLIIDYIIGLFYTISVFYFTIKSTKKEKEKYVSQFIPSLHSKVPHLSLSPHHFSFGSL